MTDREMLLEVIDMLDLLLHVPQLDSDSDIEDFVVECAKDTALGHAVLAKARQHLERTLQ